MYSCELFILDAHWVSECESALWAGARGQVASDSVDSVTVAERGHGVTKVTRRVLIPRPNEGIRRL